MIMSTSYDRMILVQARILRVEEWNVLARVLTSGDKGERTVWCL